MAHPPSREKGGGCGEEKNRIDRAMIPDSFTPFRVAIPDSFTPVQGVTQEA